MITHDRYFLDRVANRILELDRGKLYPYPGNYTKYLELKAEREELEEASERKRQNRLRNELAWIRRGAKARTTKQKARIERFEQLQADQPAEKIGKVEITAGATRLGKKVIECSQLPSPMTAIFSTGLRRKFYPSKEMELARPWVTIQSIVNRWKN